MSNILDICREYGQGPGWWDSLDHGDQVLLVADMHNRIDAHNRAVKRGQ